MSNLMLIMIGFAFGFIVAGLGLIILIKWDNDHYHKICLVPESTLIEINIVLEDLAITRIVDRGEYD